MPEPGGAGGLGLVLEAGPDNPPIISNEMSSPKGNTATFNAKAERVCVRRRDLLG